MQILDNKNLKISVILKKKLEVNLCYIIMQRMIQGRGNKSIPYRMLLTKLFKHLKIELSEEVVSECHEKSIIGKQFVERLLPKKKKKRT